jgi:hypothetical protein
MKRQSLRHAGERRPEPNPNQPRNAGARAITPASREAEARWASHETAALERPRNSRSTVRALPLRDSGCGSHRRRRQRCQPSRHAHSTRGLHPGEGGLSSDDNDRRDSWRTKSRPSGHKRVSALHQHRQSGQRRRGLRLEAGLWAAAAITALQQTNLSGLVVELMAADLDTRSRSKTTPRATSARYDIEVGSLRSTPRRHDSAELGASWVAGRGPLRSLHRLADARAHLVSVHHRREGDVGVKADEERLGRRGYPA